MLPGQGKKVSTSTLEMFAPPTPTMEHSGRAGAVKLCAAHAWRRNVTDNVNPPSCMEAHSAAGG